jgi:hypothetical protein
MRKITRDIVNAFQGRRSLTIGNSRTDGQSIWLFNNRIVDLRQDGIWITNAGWQSVTTKERLNGLTGVDIRNRRGTWILNDRPWNGDWVNLDEWNNGIISHREESAPEPEFDVTSEWMEAGYSRPVYSVFHSVDEWRLKVVEDTLSESNIPTKKMESDTEGVYRPNYFVVVRPDDFEDAMSVLSEPYCIA